MSYSILLTTMFTVFLLLSTLLVAISGDPCTTLVTQCVRSTGDWQLLSAKDNTAYVTFNLPDCGFKAGSSPLVSARLVRGPYTELAVSSSVHPWSDSYIVFVTFRETTVRENVPVMLIAQNWRIQWTATTDVVDDVVDEVQHDCCGSTKGKATRPWSGSPGPYDLYEIAEIDIAECGFTDGTSPMVSANLAGDLTGIPERGFLYRWLESTRYKVYVTFKDESQHRDYNRLLEDEENDLRVDWTADTAA